MKNIVLIFLGIVIGVIASLGSVALMAPRLMLVENLSPLPLEETVKAISVAAEKANWTISGVAELEKSVKKHGGPEVLPVRLINLCQAHHAGKILADDQARIASVLMPCTISVYTKSDGKTYIGSMNAGLMAKLFGGTIGEVMGGAVATEQQSFIQAAR